MVKRGQARKARVFSVPSHLQSAPEPKAIRERVAEIVHSPASNAVTFEVQDHEAAYLIGALVEAQRAAEAAQQQWLAVGERAQAQVFEQKAMAIGSLTTRIAQAITRRKR
jgi:hypothetical protein